MQPRRRRYALAAAVLTAGWFVTAWRVWAWAHAPAPEPWVERDRTCQELCSKAHAQVVRDLNCSETHVHETEQGPEFQTLLHAWEAGQRISGCRCDRPRVSVVCF